MNAQHIGSNFYDDWREEKAALVMGVVTGAVVTALLYGLSLPMHIAAFFTR